MKARRCLWMRPSASMHGIQCRMVMQERKLLSLHPQLGTHATISLLCLSPLSLCRGIRAENRPKEGPSSPLFSLFFFPLTEKGGGGLIACLKGIETAASLPRRWSNVIIEDVGSKGLECS